MSKSHVRGTSVEELTALDILKLTKSGKYQVPNFNETTLNWNWTNPNIANTISNLVVSSAQMRKSKQPHQSSKPNSNAFI